MYDIKDVINTIICGNSLDVLRQFPQESVNMAITSPPYWGLRSYNSPGYVWGGNANCDHDFSIDTDTGDIRLRPGNNSQVSNCLNVDIWKGNGKGHMCSICGAWIGELGHEPTPELYISHLCDIFDEVKRVLRNEGSLYVNIGDTYYGSGGDVGDKHESKNRNRKGIDYGAYITAAISQKKHLKHFMLKAKSQACIPEMFVLEMVKRGWIKRNTVIWHKPNCMPESVDDRFTRDFEPMFYFTKNNDPIYWTNEKTLELVTIKPKPHKNNKDWEWRSCIRCGGEGYYLESDCKKDPNYNLEMFLDNFDVEPDRSSKVICKACSGNGKIKYPLWSGHDTYFEQQFEPYNFNRWGGRFKKNDNVKTNGVSIHECGNQGPLNRVGYDFYPNPLGRNKRSVWKIKVASFKGAHFAVYPEELLITPIQAGCPEYVCTICGMPRIKIYRANGHYITMGGYRSKTAEHTGVSPTSSILIKQFQEKEFAGYSSCGCNAEYLPGIVLDPFMGSGTTALVSLKLRRRFIGIDSNQKYVDMAMDRVRPYLEQKTLKIINNM